jgi:hypothetical protein
MASVPRPSWDWLPHCSHSNPNADRPLAIWGRWCTRIFDWLDPKTNSLLPFRPLSEWNRHSSKLSLSSESIEARPIGKI